MYVCLETGTFKNSVLKEHLETSFKTLLKAWNYTNLTPWTWKQHLQVTVVNYG